MAVTYGMEVVKLTMEHVTVEEQLGCIDQLEGMNVCGIMLVPIEDQRIRERINRLPESIPVITYNSDISGTKRMCFVGNDHIRAGRIHIICHDTLPETIRYVKERVVDFTIGQEAFMQGYMPIEIFRDYHMFGRKPKLSRLFTGIDIRSREMKCSPIRGQVISYTVHLPHSVL